MDVEKKLRTILNECRKSLEINSESSSSDETLIHDELLRVLLRLINFPVMIETKSLQRMKDEKAKLDQEITRLNEAHGVLCNQHELEIKNKTLKKEEFKADLDDLRRTTESKTENIENVHRSNLSKHSEESINRLTLLNKKKEDLETKLNKTMAVNLKVESKLMADYMTYKTLADQKNQPLRDKIIALETNLDNEERKLDKERTELEYLQEKFRKIDIKEARQQEDDKKWAEYVNEEKKKMEIYHHPAKQLQKLYRGWKGRQSFLTLKKKLKKQKKKKKK